MQRGYIDVVADVRGAGDSQGSWGLFDPIQAQDGAELVRWAAKLPGADGKVGLYGSSYLGIDQLLTASRVGKHSPLKAIFPVIAGNDLYRDTAYFGGVPGLKFDAIFLGLTGALDMTNPSSRPGARRSPTRPTRCRSGRPRGRPGLPGPQPAPDAHDVGHAAPRLRAPPAAEPHRRRLPGSAQRARRVVRRDPDRAGRRVREDLLDLRHGRMTWIELVPA